MFHSETRDKAALSKQIEQSRVNVLSAQNKTIFKRVGVENKVHDTVLT